MLVTKKTAATLGLSIHDGVGSKVSIFARRQMEKMGWEEGKGLGKNETGISKHIKAVKRDDSSGLGLESVEAAVVNENWWHDAFSKQLKTFQTTKRNSKSKKEKSKKKDTSDDAEKPPSYADLFAATGGARLGMRARANQKGKILRTEILNGDVVLRTTDYLVDPVSKNTQECETIEPETKREKRSRDTDIIDEVKEIVTVDPVKKERKKSKGADVTAEEVVAAEPETKRKKRSRDTDDIDEVKEIVTVDPVKKKKLKGDNVIAEEVVAAEPETKRKKKSRGTDDIDEVKEIVTVDPVKKEKKKSKSDDVTAEEVVVAEPETKRKKKSKA